MEEFSVQSDDKARNTKQLFLSTTSTALTQRIGMWGESMFGSIPILGAAYSNTYLSGGRYVRSDDLSLNVKEV